MVLKNNGDRGASAGLDVNIAGAWASGYTGKGVRVAINDDGIDINHSEFQGILLKDLTFNSATKVTGANAYTQGNGGYAPDADANEHGTVVGSIVAMALDGKGMVGMAPNANARFQPCRQQGQQCRCTSHLQLHDGCREGRCFRQLLRSGSGLLGKLLVAIANQADRPIWLLSKRQASRVVAVWERLSKSLPATKVPPRLMQP